MSEWSRHVGISRCGLGWRRLEAGRGVGKSLCVDRFLDLKSSKVLPNKFCWYSLLYLCVQRPRTMGHRHPIWKHLRFLVPSVLACALPHAGSDFNADSTAGESSAFSPSAKPWADCDALSSSDGNSNAEIRPRLEAKSLAWLSPMNLSCEQSRGLCRNFPRYLLLR